MTSPAGIWAINDNGYRAYLVLAVDSAGKVTGNLCGDPIVGSWDDTAQKITFARSSGSSAPDLFAKVYTGFHFDSNKPLFDSGGCTPSVAPFQFRVLAGSSWSFSSLLAGKRGTYGWMATMGVG